MHTDLPRLQHDRRPYAYRGDRLQVIPLSRKSSKRALFVKRVLDVIGSSFLLLVFSPLIAVVALSIKAQDGGKIIHRRRVIGPNGEFDAFKLRSMRMDADELLQRDPHLREEFGHNFKLRRDPRITPVGAVIRKFSLDELPQLVNVLKGEMSLVGPRMITPAELEKYGEAGWIFNVQKPGLTGYWQTQGRQEVSYARRVELDLFYVKNWSLLLDLKILIKTPIAVLRGAGAY
jgi:lipopolysaccharide/colanic/teichoic acid biosynthesis glycosyltransferase